MAGEQLADAEELFHGRLRQRIGRILGDELFVGRLRGHKGRRQGDLFATTETAQQPGEFAPGQVQSEARSLILGILVGGADGFFCLDVDRLLGYVEHFERAVMSHDPVANRPHGSQPWIVVGEATLHFVQPQQGLGQLRVEHGFHLESLGQRSRVALRDLPDAKLARCQLDAELLFRRQALLKRRIGRFGDAEMSACQVLCDGRFEFADGHGGLRRSCGDQCGERFDQLLLRGAELSVGIAQAGLGVAAEDSLGERRQQVGAPQGCLDPDVLAFGKHRQEFFVRGNREAVGRRLRECGQLDDDAVNHSAGRCDRFRVAAVRDDRQRDLQCPGLRRLRGSWLGGP